jgi:ATP-dependent Clp protease, protease subunit
MKTEFFQIENRAGKLKLNDGVNKQSADKLIDEIERLYGDKAVDAQMMIGEIVASADDALKSVEIEINSPGGSVFEGMRIYHSLRGLSDRGVNVITTVNGLAASMGSVILMAGDQRGITAGSQIMIHEPSSIAMGDARDMKRTANLLENIANDLANIYSDRTGYDKEKIRNMMLDETWINSDTAEELGFARAIDKSDEYDKDKPMSIFAKLFPNAASEQIEAAQAEVDRVTADFEASQSKIASLESSITDHAATIAARDERIVEIEAEVAKRDAEIEAKQSEIASKESEIETIKARIEDLESEVEAAKASAGEQAITMLASVGQSEPVSEPQANPKTITAETFWATYNDLKQSDPKAATKFFRANADKASVKMQ